MSTVFPIQMLIKEHEDEIKALRMELAMHDTLVSIITTITIHVCA